MKKAGLRGAPARVEVVAPHPPRRRYQITPKAKNSIDRAMQSRQEMHEADLEFKRGLLNIIREIADSYKKPEDIPFPAFATPFCPMPTFELSVMSVNSQCPKPHVNMELPGLTRDALTDLLNALIFDVAPKMELDFTITAEPPEKEKRS